MAEGPALGKRVGVESHVGVVGENRAARSLFCFCFFPGEMGYNKLWQSNRLGEVRGDEFFQVQIEATECLLTSNTQSQASTAH